MIDNSTALRRRFADESGEAPPDWLIAAHRDFADFTANPDALRSLLGPA